MNLIRTVRTPVSNEAFEPFALVRNLMRWDPFREMEAVSSAFFPAFDIRETSEGYLFQADLPGVQQEDLDIQLSGNRLSISGKREAEARREGENRFIAERSYGNFCRTFNLPEGVDGNAVKAELRNGVLNLLVPKVPEVQPRKIAIAS